MRIPATDGWRAALKTAPGADNAPVAELPADLQLQQGFGRASAELKTFRGQPTLEVLMPCSVPGSCVSAVWNRANTHCSQNTAVPYSCVGCTQLTSI